MKKTIAVIVLIFSLAWAGVCAYSIMNPQTGALDMPKPDEAQYSVHIKNTGGMLLTNDYEVMGDNPAVYVLHGYWEMSGKDFKFRDRDIVLDEAIFGEITIRRR